MSLVRSIQRVADHGEVFTLAWLVSAGRDAGLTFQGGSVILIAFILMQAPPYVHNGVTLSGHKP